MQWTDASHNFGKMSARGQYLLWLLALTGSTSNLFMTQVAVGPQISLVRSLAPSPDALVSVYTPCKFSAPISSAGPVRGTHAVGHHATEGYSHPLSDGSRTLLGFQIFAWNIACVGSLVVPVVFWAVLVRRTSHRARIRNLALHALPSPNCCVDLAVFALL